MKVDERRAMQFSLYMKVSLCFLTRADYRREMPSCLGPSGTGFSLEPLERRPEKLDSLSIVTVCRILSREVDKLALTVTVYARVAGKCISRQ